MMATASDETQTSTRRPRCLKEPTGKIDLADLVETFGLPTWERVEETNSEYLWESARQLADDPNDEESRFEAEVRATDELFRSWYDAAIAAVGALYEAHGLKLEPIRPRRAPADARCWDLRVVPVTSWIDAAAKILETVNGAGPFEYRNLREFVDATGGTARRAVLSHLGWIASYPAVYGSASAMRLYERAWS